MPERWDRSPYLAMLILNTRIDQAFAIGKIDVSRAPLGDKLLWRFYGRPRIPTPRSPDTRFSLYAEQVLARGTFPDDRLLSLQFTMQEGQ